MGSVCVVRHIYDKLNVKIKGITDSLSLSDTHKVSGVADAPPTTTTDEVVMHVSAVDVPETGHSTFPGVIKNSNDSLHDFLSRPIVIANFNTTVGNLAIQPWALYLGNADIKDKTRYYTFLRATLVLQFLMPDASFVAGRMLVSYDPNETGKFSRSSALTRSNLPHVILDPGISNNVIMKIPYCQPADYYTLYNPMPATMWLHTDITSVFKNASTLTPVNMNIRVLAHVEDVQLVISSIQPQSEFKADGVISKPARVISNVAKALSLVPVIGPYATATGQMAEKIGNLASMFGYTKPIQLADPVFVKPKLTGTMATTSGLDMSTKLMLDPKAEKTIDPRIVYGNDKDEMVISSIVQRPTYMKTYTWSSLDVVGTNITSIFCTPCLYDTLAVNDILMSNVCFVASAFNFWRGTLRYHLSLVKTKFHKGKLRIVWSFGNVAPTANNTHLGYNIIWDLSEQSELDVEVPYNLQTKQAPTFMSPFPGFVATGTNGTLYIEVMEPLTGPGDVAEVDLEVWVSGGDDMEFSSPTLDHIRQLVTALPLVGTIPPRIGVEVPWAPTGLFGDAVNLNPSGSLTPEGVADGCYNNIKIAPPTTDNNAMLISIGEVVLSVRDLVKRYCSLKVEAASSNSDFYPVYPEAPGALTVGGIVGISGNNQTFISYFSPAYVAIRGSTRYKFISEGVTTLNLLGATRAYSQPFRTDNRVSYQYNKRFGGGAHGVQLSSTELDGSLEVEIPDMKRTAFAFVENITRSEAVQNGVFVSNAAESGNLIIYNCAADDFSLDWYLGPPAYYNFLNGAGIPVGPG